MHRSTEKALEQLSTRIRTGEWAENSFLPTERQLCEELEVGRGAIAAIFRELALRGLICLEPGRGARVLSGVSTGLRQVLVIEDSNYSISNSAEHLQLLGHISKVTAARGIGMSLSFTGAGHPIKPFLDRYARDEYQAIIVVERPELVDIDLLLQHGIPTVIINYETAGKYPCVRVDFREVGRIAGREFMKNGLRRIGVLSGAADSFFCREMLAGLKGVLAEEDIELSKRDIIFWTSPVDVDTQISTDAVPSPDQHLAALLTAADRPEAFFVIRDWRAAKLYDVCRKLNLKIADDISIISYDNLSWIDSPLVGLTTISEPTEELANQSINMLREWKRTGQRPADVEICGNLIARSSVKESTSAITG